MKNFIYNTGMVFIPYCFGILSVTNGKPFNPLFIIVLIATILVIYDKIYSIRDKEDE